MPPSSASAASSRSRRCSTATPSGTNWSWTSSSGRGRRRSPGRESAHGADSGATFSPELADLTIYVIDVAGGEKVPRKGGPAITRSDLLVVNKIDLAPHVGADLEVMAADARRMRGDRPFVFTDLPRRKGVEQVADFIAAHGALDRGR